jgi:hypothetical protein
MSPDKRPDAKLPVTGEVGSEGGSYADAAAGRMSTVTETAARGPLAGTSVGVADDTASGMIRYPTEPPSRPDAREGRSFGSHPWRLGLIGLAAGTAALIGVSRLRRRT